MNFPVFEWEIEVVSFLSSYGKYPLVQWFMEYVSDFSRTWYWVALVAVISSFVYGFKTTWIRVAFIAASVGVSDVVARYAVKEFIQRPRPTHLGLDCSMSDCWGFVSSHAANVAVAATILIILNKKNANWAVPIVLLVGLSRIVLNKHFPLDILGGYGLGILIGFLVTRLLAIDPVQKFFSRKAIGRILAMLILNLH